MSRCELPNKFSGETKTYTFDFSSQLDSGVTISTQVVTASVYSGTDASPSDVISGAASASGAVVSQKITAGVEGVIYKLLCKITTSDSQTLELSGYTAVTPEVP